MTAVASSPVANRAPSASPTRSLTYRSKGPRVIRFIETHCVYTDGEWVGQPARLLPWQKDFITELFRLREDGVRQYRWALLGVPKKNGKTQMAAWLALYFLIADGEPSPLVVCAAASDEQADLVFDAAKRCCELSPTLAQLTQPFQREIQVDGGGRLKRVAAVAGTNDGKNIHAVITDELHEWTGPKGRAVWNVLTNGTGARRQPMVLQITTAGWDQETICYQQYLYGRQVLNGEIDDPRYLFRWYEAPERCDIRDPRVWEAANPSFGITVRADFFEDQLPPKKTEGVFRRYFLNQWTEAAEFWLPVGAWEKCAIGAFEFDVDAPMYVAVDASIKHDATAAVAAQWLDGRLCMQASIWEPTMNPATGEPEAGWEMPEEELEAHLRQLWERYPVAAIGADPAYIRSLLRRLADDGLPVEEIPQSAARMAPASQTLYELIVNGTLAHTGDPAFSRHIRNAVKVDVYGGDGGFRLSKGRARRVNDAAIAAAMCAALAMRAESETVAPAFWSWDEAES